MYELSAPWTPSSIDNSSRIHSPMRDIAPLIMYGKPSGLPSAQQRPGVLIREKPCSAEWAQVQTLRLAAR